VTKREYYSFSKHFSFKDENQLVVELDDVEVLKQFAFGKPDAPPVISNLADLEAVDALSA